MGRCTERTPAAMSDAGEIDMQHTTRSAVKLTRVAQS